jgi:DNA-binding NarL/FixJ family response regulator
MSGNSIRVHRDSSRSTAPDSPACDVAVIAENRLLRDLVSELLATRPGFHLVSPTSSMGDESSGALGEVAAARVILLCPSEMSSPEQILQQIAPFRNASPLSRLILFGMPEEETFFLAAVRAGVAGYVLEEASTDDVLDAVRSAAEGKVVCPARLLPALFRCVASLPLFSFNPIAPNPYGLSRRERQLVPLIARGLTNKQIASELCLSEQTVKNHLRRMMRKAGAGNRLGVVERCHATAEGTAAAG